MIGSETSAQALRVGAEDWFEDDTVYSSHGFLTLAHVHRGSEGQSRSPFVSNMYDLAPRGWGDVEP
jgi:hypothetical protein